MDVVLSISAGLGLRLFLASAPSVPSNPLTTAVLGLWEGVVLHQISGRSTSPHLDHLLAYVLRILVDLLVTKNLQRLVVVVLWSVLGVFSSEVLVPHESLRAALKEERRRHRPSRSVPAAGPTFAAPLPSRVRAYRQPDPEPDQTTSTPYLPEDPPPQSSTPIFRNVADQPRTPPSFYLRENIVLSPSPKPVQLQLQAPDKDREALPVRPRSGLASVLDHSSDSGSPLPVLMPLPTPPDSAQASSDLNDPNDTYHDNHLRYESQLYTIPEGSSPEDGVTPPASNLSGNGHENGTGTRPSEITTFLIHTINTGDAPLPVPIPSLQKVGDATNWLSSGLTHRSPESIFPNPFAATSSEEQVHGEPLWPINTPIDQVPGGFNSDIKSQGRFEDYPDSEPDQLRTPGTRQMMIKTDSEHEVDLLQTPKQQEPESKQFEDLKEQQLSPLGLNVRSALDHDECDNRVSDGTPPSASYSNQDPSPPLQTPTLTQMPTAHETYPARQDVVESEEDLPMPGSLSQMSLLQPPLLPSGTILQHPSQSSESPSPPPPPRSPTTTILTDISTLSTRVPDKLYRRAEELRKQAREDEKLRAQLESERKLAENEGRTFDALNLKIKIRDLDAETEKMHERAARRYFHATNPVTKFTGIDVHGLRPREAFDRIERAIIKASTEKRKTIRVIVGQGHHSVGKIPVLKFTVQRELERLKIDCVVHDRNPGVLIVTVPRPS